MTTKNCRKIATIYFGVSLLAGLVPLYFSISDRSMERNAILFGYSSSRLALIFIQLIAFLTILGFYLVVRKNDNSTCEEKLNFLRIYRWNISLVLLFVFSIMLAWALMRPDSPAFFNTMPVLFSVRAILVRLLPSIVWFAFVAFGALIVSYIFYPDYFLQQETLAFFSAALVAGIIVTDIIVRNRLFRYHFLNFFLDHVLITHGLWLLTLISFALFLTWYLRRNLPSEDVIVWRNFLLIIISFWLAYHATAWFVGGRAHSPNKAYFPELAQSYLNGIVFLSNPSQTTDLTFYNGNWHVAFAPLAALLLLPQVFFGGADSVNTVYFTIVFSALNVGILYLILEKLSTKGWIGLNRKDFVWIIVLLGFGTVHWYMSGVGQVWYISQILTVTFSALSVYLLLQTDSPILSGISLALAMLARPNIILLWPLLFGIYWQGNLKSTDWRREIKNIGRWISCSAIPIVIVIFSLLWYNNLRFDNPFEFGYSAMNVGPNIKPDLQQYGQFNWRFIERNLYTMLFLLPSWSSTCNFFVPSGEGVSILITTPALLYLRKSFQKQPWILGAWVSIALLLLPLIFYFNTGSFQFGYRFLMDLIISITLLLAFAAGKKITLNMKLLILLGILVNYWGYVWFYTKWCA